MPLIQWIMQNLSKGGNILRCQSSCIANARAFKRTILSCESTCIAHGKVVALQTILSCESTCTAHGKVIARTVLPCESTVTANANIRHQTILRCVSTLNARTYQSQATLKCTSAVFARATVLPGPISGTAPYATDRWNLAGVYAILPNNYRKHKFIEIIFKFGKDTYRESRYTENEVTIRIRDVEFEEGKEFKVRPIIKIESISFEAISSKLLVQLESVQKEHKKKKKTPSVVLVGIK